MKNALEHVDYLIRLVKNREKISVRLLFRRNCSNFVVGSLVRVGDRLDAMSCSFGWFESLVKKQNYSKITLPKSARWISLTMIEGFVKERVAYASIGIKLSVNSHSNNRYV